MSYSSDSTYSNLLKFNRANYSSWARQMKAYLISKSYDGVVLLREPRPSPDPNTSQHSSSSLAQLEWDNKNRLAGSMVFLKLDEQRQVELDDFIDDGFQLWQKLESKYVDKGSQGRFNNFEDLFNLRKKEEESMDDVIGRVNRIMKRITTTRPSNFTVADLEAELHAMCLLRSLADLEDYYSFSSSLLLLNSLSVYDIETVVRKEKKNRQKREVINSDSSVSQQGLHLHLILCFSLFILLCIFTLSSSSLHSFLLFSQGLQASFQG